MQRGHLQMLTKMKKKTEGFTIVEVMIVLAIGALILLVVLMAVPALNRNKRNTQRKEDVSAILGALNEYGVNNGGALPPDASAITSLANLSFYTASDVNYAISPTAVSGNPGADANTVYVRTFAKCSGNAMTGAGATRRNIATLYFVETPTSTSAICQET
jgi:prepilin-type N-terminal cleavage/methylation domain-containing protein